MDRGSGWWTYLRYDEQRDRPAVSWALTRRVAGYARPYVCHIAVMLLVILASTGLGLIPPLLQRSLGHGIDFRRGPGERGKRGA